MKADRKIWFESRPSGLGWVPVAWQGWAVVMVWVAVFAGFVSWSDLSFSNVWVAMAISIVFGGFWLGILYGLVSMKGAKPRRQRTAESSESDVR